MRTALAVVVLALALPSTAAAADVLSVSFTGSGTEHLVDVQSWILLEENECYLRKSIDQTAALSWTLGWKLRLGAKVGVPAGTPSMQGPLSGTEVGDLCGQPENELPPDTPENWIHTSPCTDTLAAGPGALTAAVRGSTLVLAVTGPQYALPQGAVCSLRPRSTELRARVAVKLKALAPGKTVRIPVGTAGSDHLNCMHAAKPYDGYRSLDECGDDLSWQGTIVVTRSRG